MQTAAVVFWLLFVLSLSILRRIQSGIFESSLWRRQNCIDNVFICVNFAEKDFGRVLSTGYTKDNAIYAQPKCTVSGERANDWQDSTVLTAARTAGAGSVCKD